MTRDFSPDELKAIHARAMKRFDTAQGYWSKIYERMNEHLEFYGGKQWDDKAKTERDQRPCITLDKTATFVNRIVNEARKVDPEIKINPNYNGADDSNLRLAEILQGYCRYVEHLSNARSTYANSIENSTIMGMGFLRICNKYEKDVSFDQEFFIEKLETPFNVYLDPAFKKIDGSDANWAFIFDSVERSEYEKNYATVTDKVVGFDFTNFSKVWYPNADEIVLAEYFEKFYEEEYLLELSDGVNIIRVFESRMTDEAGEILPQYANLQIVRKKKVERCKVYWFKMDGQKIIDYTEFPSTYIPVIPTLGVTVWRNKKKDYVGLLHYLISPQQMYNYFKSCEVELAGLAPKSPIIAASGQIDRYKGMWENANTKNYAYLPYDPQSLNGTPVPPPQRLDNGANIGQFQAAAASCFEDMKSAVSIYDAALGATEQGESGRAILLKTEQSVNGNIHYLYNLKRSIEQVGRILVDIFQNVVSKSDSIRIMSGDSKVETILNIPGTFKDEDLENLAITVSTGSAYASKRTEEADRIIQLLNVLPPQMGAVVADLLVKNLDLDQGEEIVKRIRTQLPPNVFGDEQTPMDPQIMAVLEQSKKTIDQLNAMVNDLNKQLQDKTMENLVKLDIEKLKSATTLAEAEIKANTELLIKNPTSMPTQSILNNQIKNDVQMEAQDVPVLTPLVEINPQPNIPPMISAPDMVDEQATQMDFNINPNLPPSFSESGLA